MTEAPKPYAAATTDYLGCEYISLDIEGIEKIAAAGSQGPTEVVYLYAGSLPPQSQMVGWQDISTAPKTGEEFIARTGPEWSSFSCSWDGEMFVHYDRDDGIIAYGPKQWMPMPGPETALAKMEDQP